MSKVEIIESQVLLQRCPVCRRLSVIFDPSLDGGAGSLVCIWKGKGCGKEVKQEDGGAWKKRLKTQRRKADVF